MTTCGQCLYFVRVPEAQDEPAGQCYGMPPTLMLLPVVPVAASGRVAVPGANAPVQAQLQALRPVLMADSLGCSLYRPAVAH